MKDITWRKHGDHTEVVKIPGAKDEPGWDCLVSDCDAPWTGHGIAVVGPHAMRVIVHPGDLIEGTGKSLVVISHGMRYGDPDCVV